MLDDGVIYMLNIQDFIGESSTEADRKRVYRRKIEEEKSGQMSGQMSDKCTPEIRDKRLEIRDKRLDDDEAKYISEINNLIKNKISSSSLDNFINRFGVNKLDSLISEIKDSDYLKGNINFNNLSDDFIDKAISGKYRTYKDDDSSNDEDEVNIYAGIEPIRGYIK